MNLAGLQSLLARAPSLTLACVGDLMLDRFVYGEVSRISPEAPVPVLRTHRSVSMPGGVGNVARNLASLGTRVTLGSVAGQDVEGRALADLLAAEPGLTDAVRYTDTARTVVKTRYVAAGQQLLRLDEEDTLDTDYAGEGVFEGADAILISDYAKGVVSDALIAAALAHAAQAGVPVIVDPKGRDFARYGAVDLIKPNAAELAADTDAEVERALSALLDQTTAKAVIVTRAGKGMSLMRRGGAVQHIPARAREVFDVSGAGDTGLAALGLALAAGHDLPDAAAFAILASGVVVGKSGTATVTPPELLEAELTGAMDIDHGRIVPVETLVDQVDLWKAAGLKVGFTNGCFDILHRGHVAYLAQARAWCDRLVVALNTDESVRRLKGDGRPVNDLDSRAAVIGGLASVDRVTSFDTATPLDLIKALRPDVLIKGADYTRDTVVGAVEVESWGGEVRLAEFSPGHSTTATIQKLAKGEGQ